MQRNKSSNESKDALIKAADVEFFSRFGIWREMLRRHIQRRIKLLYQIRFHLIKWYLMFGNSNRWACL